MLLNIHLTKCVQKAITIKKNCINYSFFLDKVYFTLKSISEIIFPHIYHQCSDIVVAGNTFLRNLQMDF